MGVRHSVSVAAAVVDATGRVLVVQRRDGGRWEPGEVERRMKPVFAVRLRDALAGGDPSVRAHDGVSVLPG